MQTPSNFLPEYSDKFDIVLTQLMKAKSEMGSSVKKDSSNPFHKSKYASLGAHLELSESILYKHGLIMMHTPNLIDGNSVLIATIHHPESSQWIKSYLPLPNQKNDSQGLGSSLTYMRRYSINSMLGLTAEDDDGETSSGRGQYTKKEEIEAQKQKDLIEKNKINPKQVKIIKSLEEKLDKECKERMYDWLKKVHQTTEIEDITTDSFTRILIGFENAVKYMDTQQKQDKVQRLEVAHA